MGYACVFAHILRDACICLHGIVRACETHMSSYSHMCIVHSHLHKDRNSHVFTLMFVSSCSHTLPWAHTLCVVMHSCSYLCTPQADTHIHWGSHSHTLISHTHTHPCTLSPVGTTSTWHLCPESCFSWKVRSCLPSSFARSTQVSVLLIAALEGKDSAHFSDQQTEGTSSLRLTQHVIKHCSSPSVRVPNTQAPGHPDPKDLSDFGFSNNLFFWVSAACPGAPLDRNLQVCHLMTGERSDSSPPDPL